MNRCPITYELCGTEKYSEKGLRLIAPKLSTLKDLPFSAAEQRQEAANRAKKLSIQGVQPKLSAVISVVNQQFEIVDQFGNYIIKPQSDIFPELPENEDVTMKMAKVFGLEVPLHGMIYSKDGSLSYFIKRFDRYSKGKKYATEDFTQLTGNSRDTKYNFTMEKVVNIIEEFCTFPAIEKADFFKRVLFCVITEKFFKCISSFPVIKQNKTRLKKSAFSIAGNVQNSSITLTTFSMVKLYLVSREFPVN